MYDERLVTPMREELTVLGFEELRTPEDVDRAVQNGDETILLVVNSVCGCAAANARPALAQAVQHAVKPARLTTVFAGQDHDATARARSYFTGYRPSSPSIALMKGGQVAFMLERHQIEGREAADIASDLVAAFDTHCT